MKKVLSLLIAIVILSVFVLTSCNFLNTKNITTTRRLFGEKDMVVDGKTVFTKEDIMSWFEKDIAAFFSKSMEKHQFIDYYIGNFGYIFICENAENAHLALMSKVPDVWYDDSALYRINNIVLYDQEYNRESKREWKEEFERIFEISDEDFKEFTTPTQFKKLRITPVEDIIEYFKNNDNYEVDEMENMEKMTNENAYDRVIFNSELLFTTYMYTIKDKKTNTYISIQKYEEEDKEEEIVCTFDIRLLLILNDCQTNRVLNLSGTIIYQSPYIICVPNNYWVELFESNNWR